MRIFAAAALAVVLTHGLVRADDAPALVGQEAPEVSSAGWINAPAPVTLTALRGKAVVLCFWASWDPKSRKATEALRELWTAHNTAAFRILALTDETEERVAQFVAATELPFIVGYETTSKPTYNIQDLPTALVIGPDGKILWRGDPLDPALAPAVASAIQLANQ